MTEPSTTESISDVALFCERCILTVKRYLALLHHETYLQNDLEDVPALLAAGASK